MRVLPQPEIISNFKTINLLQISKMDLNLHEQELQLAEQVRFDPRSFNFLIKV